MVALAVFVFHSNVLAICSIPNYTQHMYTYTLYTIQTLTLQTHSPSHSTCTLTECIFVWFHRLHTTHTHHTHSPSCAFFVFSSRYAHCNIRGSDGAAKKNVLLKVPILRMCWRFLYSSPSSKLIQLRRSITRRGAL